MIDLTDIDFSRVGTKEVNGRILLVEERKYPNTEQVQGLRVPEGKIITGREPLIAEKVNHCSVFGGITKTSAGIEYALAHVPPCYEQIQKLVGGPTVREMIDEVLGFDRTFVVHGQEEHTVTGLQIPGDEPRSIGLLGTQLTIYTRNGEKVYEL